MSRKVKICISVFLAALTAVLSGCGTTDDEMIFSPDRVSVNMLLSSFYCPETDDSALAEELYALSTGAVLTGETDSPDLSRSVEVVFTESATGRRERWYVCRDGSCSWDGESYYLMENGESVYHTVKSAWDGLNDIDDFAERLYALKTDYIGDQTADIAILEALGVEQTIGSFTIQLHTETEPYGLTVHLTRRDDILPMEDVDQVMGRYGYLFLALVDNAGVFSWDYSTAGGVHSCTVDTAGRFDVKPFGESRDSFRELCGVIDSISAYDNYPVDVMISTDRDSYIMYGAKADTVSSLWQQMRSVQTQACAQPPETGDAETISVVFYNGSGDVIAAWSFTGSVCRVDGGSEYFDIIGGKPDITAIKYIYESSKTSPDYSRGVYSGSTVFTASQG